ncbi:MAG: SPFH/Band domain protein, partial [Pseudonocardiales bacterium]|nr:SPFH/Band domain protein [Pseudonocardiales bacterium]
PLDTSTWFDSSIPPAAVQPEAANLRASDNDPASREAHAGLPDEPVTESELPSLVDGQFDPPPSSPGG